LANRFDQQHVVLNLVCLVRHERVLDLEDDILESLKQLIHVQQFEHLQHVNRAHHVQGEEGRNAAEQVEKEQALHVPLANAIHVYVEFLVYRLRLQQVTERQFVIVGNRGEEGDQDVDEHDQVKK